jgi:hypothetical protein
MDWHSSGITTSVMGALKRAINPRYNELGIFIAGGKGKQSLKTPAELIALSNRTGLNGDELVRSSKLSAKVDNNAIQDGFQLYLHNFIVTAQGDWAVIQQGMNDASGMARRYHWNSSLFKSFTEAPHAFIYGKNAGPILNLTAHEAVVSKKGMLDIVAEEHRGMMKEIVRLVMPSHHDVRSKDVNLKRLGSTLALANENNIRDFESLLLLEGVGPRTIQSLALVSEVIHGTPTRFEDPARFSFAHGGKDGHPFPVPTKVYDETIHHMKEAISRAKLGFTDKSAAIKNLSLVSQMLEENFTAQDNFDKLVGQERANSYRYGGRTVYGKSLPPKNDAAQLRLFE